MINLANKELPSTIEVNGSFFKIKTNFRDWLKFGELIKDDHLMQDYLYLFPGSIPNPNDDIITELLKFYNNPNSTPHDRGGTKDVIVDFMQDGEYIYSAFLQAYGIDLFDIDYLHWHKFQALFRSLPEECLMSQIMGYRSFNKYNAKKSQEKIYQEQKEIWRLPFEVKQNEETVHELEELFYNSI